MIVEVSQFRLAPGTEERAFLEAAREIAVAVRFETADAAKAAFESFAGHPDAKAFESMLDPSAVTLSHWSVAKSW